jgi:hypothetical protein
MEPRFDRVREWFISDGMRGANAALAHSQDTGHEVIEACERFVDTLTFEAGD